MVADSTLPPPCLRLRPSDIVQLGISDGISVVVPEVTLATPDVCHLALYKIHQRIDALFFKLCAGITVSEHSEQLEILHHQGGCVSFKYAVLTRKYTGRYCIENEGLRKTNLDCLWSNDGFRINIEVCGYARSSPALLQMKHFAYLKIYKRSSKMRTTEGTCEGKGDRNETLVKKLWLTRGCVSSTLKVLMSYHKKTED